MLALNRDLKRTRVAVISMIATSTLCLPSLIGAEGAQAAIIKRCPTAESLKAAAGVSLKVHLDESGAIDRCDYMHALAGTKYYNVYVAAAPLTESVPSLLDSVKIFAKDVKGPFKELSGIGAAAWEYTAATKLAGDPAPVTTVTIVVGKRYVTVEGTVPAANILAVAKQVS